MFFNDLDSYTVSQIGFKLNIFHSVEAEDNHQTLVIVCKHLNKFKKGLKQSKKGQRRRFVVIRSKRQRI